MDRPRYFHSLIAHTHRISVTFNRWPWQRPQSTEQAEERKSEHDKYFLLIFSSAINSSSSTSYCAPHTHTHTFLYYAERDRRIKFVISFFSCWFVCVCNRCERCEQTEQVWSSGYWHVRCACLPTSRELITAHRIQYSGRTGDDNSVRFGYHFRLVGSMLSVNCK